MLLKGRDVLVQHWLSNMSIICGGGFSYGQPPRVAFLEGRHECPQNKMYILYFIIFFYLFALISSGCCIGHLHNKSMMSCCHVGSRQLGALCFIKVCLPLREPHTEFVEEGISN